MSLQLNPPFCFSRGRSRSLADRVHASISGAVWYARSGAAERLRLVLRLACWPLVAAALAGIALARWGGWVRKRTGKGRPRQLAECYALALARAVPPFNYYLYRLYEDSKRAASRDYLHRSVTKNGVVYPILRWPRFDPNPILSDKAHFWKRCVERSVPTAPILLELAGGQVTSAASEPPEIPLVDVFVKPRRSQGGKGAQRWSFTGGEFRSADGEVRSREGLLEDLLDQSRGQSLVVQTCLLNHPAISDLSNGALLTARIMTLKNEQGLPEPTTAVFRMAAGANTVVDNIHAGGIASGVDLETGRLGPAARLDPATDWTDTHPDTRAPITGRLLPDWEETVALARRAHVAFDEFGVVGWDVAFTPKGPVIVEGNTASCMNLLQRPLDRGLAASRFGELLAFNLDRAVAGER